MLSTLAPKAFSSSKKLPPVSLVQGLINVIHKLSYKIRKSLQNYQKFKSFVL